MTKDTFIHVRLDKDTYDYYVAQSDHVSLPLSTYIRMLLKHIQRQNITFPAVSLIHAVSRRDNIYNTVDKQNTFAVEPQYTTHHNVPNRTQTSLKSGQPAATRESWVPPLSSTVARSSTNTPQPATTCGSWVPDEGEEYEIGSDGHPLMLRYRGNPRFLSLPQELRDGFEALQTQSERDDYWTQHIRYYGK